MKTSIQNEQKTSYALQDKQLVHISDVNSGLDCNCVCIACGGRLVAKKGEKNEHHFAHHVQPDSPCNESIIHYLSKEIVQQYKKIGIPEVELIFETRDMLDDIHCEQIFENAATLLFQEVRVEKYNGSYIPDITAITEHGEIIDIEFVVTHDVDETKLNKIKSGNHTVLSIDMSGYSSMDSFDELKNAVLYQAPRKWVNNPNHAALLVQLKSSVQQQVDERNAYIVEKMEKVMSDNNRRADSKSTLRQPKEDEVILLGYKSAYGFSPKTQKDYDFSVLHIADPQYSRTSENYTTRSVAGFDINKRFTFEHSVIPQLEALQFPCIVALRIGNKLRNGRMFPVVIDIEQRD